jgi:nucleotide-binding universal stress UspA family protein
MEYRNACVGGISDIPEKPMFKSLVVPLDGSEIGEYALSPAIGLASRHKASIRLVRVYVPVAGTYGERGASYDEVLDRTLMQRAQSHLQKIVQRTSEIVDVPVSARLLEGPVADAIERHAMSIGADLLVMTTRARGPFVRFWLGSVADSLARRSEIPILFIQPDEDVEHVEHEGSFKHVLIPLDGSELAEQAIRCALAIGADDNTRYTLLRAIPTLLPITALAAGSDFSIVPESVYKALQESQAQHKVNAQAYLTQMAESLSKRVKNVQTRLISNDKPADAILMEAKAHKVDLIAMTSRGQGGFKRMVLGSVADKVLRGSETPVLLCPPAGGSNQA